MRIKEPKLIERITGNFGMALLVGIVLILIARYVDSQESVIGATLRAITELTGYYLLIRAVFKWNKRRRDKKTTSKCFNASLVGVLIIK